ncbi:metallophosphatase [Bacillus phage AR9]|uniref:Metallophosphatase n=1 Tax=Bacillus phage AR9 TaxID=1815509 RepID=A0A172JHS7_BPPB1|nr:phosphoesterase [Bacillus phage AR9]AMS01102.1 metallophosphatase [Bacillus phage AR9]
MTNWVISDPHFGHKGILKYEEIRDFNNTDEMDEAIIKNFNDIVSEGDTVFWLGDMFFCKTERMKYIVDKLKKTRNILVLGNHDNGVSKTKFKRFGFMPYRMYQYKDLILTHEPLSEVNLKILSEYGITKNIHGHVHSNIEGMNQDKYKCVSIECTDLKPINIDSLSSINPFFEYNIKFNVTNAFGMICLPLYKIPSEKELSIDEVKEMAINLLNKQENDYVINEIKITKKVLLDTEITLLRGAR